VRDVIEFLAGHRRTARPAPDLGQRDADQPGVQLTLGRQPLPARRAQAAQPGQRLFVEAGQSRGTFHDRQATFSRGLPLLSHSPCLARPLPRPAAAVAGHHGRLMLHGLAWLA
jgi:hypothetical protein